MRRALLFSLLVSSQFSPGLAEAQANADAAQASDPSRDASARALFEEGLTLAEQGSWELAEDRFRRAYSLRASPVIAYNLASALVERGKLIEASELLLKVEHDDKVDATLKASAQTLQADLSTRFGHITVEVRDKQASDQVAMDDGVLVDAQLGVEIPIDPGTHRIALLRAGEALDEQSIAITSGQAAHVTLHGDVAPSPEQVAAAAPPAPGPAPALAPAAPAAKPTRESGAVTGKWWFWTGIGVVAAAAIVGSVVAVSSGGGDNAAHAFQGDFAPGSLKVEVAR
jgi:hypothetical protein